MAASSGPPREMVADPPLRRLVCQGDPLWNSSTDIMFVVTCSYFRSERVLLTPDLPTICRGTISMCLAGAASASFAAGPTLSGFGPVGLDWLTSLPCP